MKTIDIRGPAVLAVVTMATLACTSQRALAADISYRNFSPAAAMGPPADAYAAKLQSITSTVLGPTGEVRFVRLPGTPAIPAKFSGNIVSAVAAGTAGGGFDAAYNSGSELNKTWGFIFNSGVPFGPSFDEFLGFLYGKSVDGRQTGLELIQSLLDLNGRNVVVFPIVGNAEQLSGFFPRPIGDVAGHRGIGLAGLCAQPWTLRYLPPGENVLGQACDDLVAEGEISAKNLKFIAAIPGGGSLVDAVKSGQLQGFEFATPLDDLSTLFTGVDNPGTVGVPFVHLPGWQQQFLVTWMIVNKQVWNGLTQPQQILALSVARDHLVSSYGENMAQQGPSLRTILDANRLDGSTSNDIVLSKWPERDQRRLIAATNRFLNARAADATLPAADRRDYAVVLEAFRKYVRANDLYWDERKVDAELRFDGWTSPSGEGWEAPATPGQGQHRGCGSRDR
jgi:TRAP-type mannitol/chloroaromatic compound transport system substrate-binding protein